MNHTEIELKLRLPDPRRGPDIFAQALRLAPLSPPPQTEHLESWYFDTPSHALQRAGVAYRLRLEKKQWIATIKAGGSSDGGLHRRQEWNAPAAGPAPSLDYFAGTAAKALAAKLLGQEELVPLFSTVFDRQSTHIATNSGDVVELAVDTGRIIAGNRQDAISEVELELKEGDAAAVLAFGAKLARAIPLFVEERSKYARGLTLAGLAPSFAPPLPLRPLSQEESAVSALKTLLIHAVQHLFHSMGQPEQASPARLRKLYELLKAAEPLTLPEALASWAAELESLLTAGETLLPADRLTPLLLEIWAAAARKDGGLFRPTAVAWGEFASSSPRNAADPLG
ncbi:MAG TPA: CYTH domain-containing protein [Selenomonadales bacterium]|nr:CYTH domain-containing protein [Selenomonadales bacterium]